MECIEREFFYALVDVHYLTTIRMHYIKLTSPYQRVIVQRTKLENLENAINFNHLDVCIVYLSITLVRHDTPQSIPYKRQILRRPLKRRSFVDKSALQFIYYLSARDATKVPSIIDDPKPAIKSTSISCFSMPQLSYNA